jgi:large subunit ribosomal protein L22
MVGHKLGEFALTRTFKGHPADKSCEKGKDHGNTCNPPGRSSVGHKGRLVADLIRGKSGSSAQHPEFHAEKLLESSRRWLSPSPTLNITMRDIDDLKVKTIYVEQGATLCVFCARAKGRGNSINKPTCHVRGRWQLRQTGQKTTQPAFVRQPQLGSAVGTQQP